MSTLLDFPVAVKAEAVAPESRGPAPMPERAVDDPRHLMFLHAVQDAARRSRAILAGDAGQAVDRALAELAASVRTTKSRDFAEWLDRRGALADMAAEEMCARAYDRGFEDGGEAIPCPGGW